MVKAMIYTIKSYSEFHVYTIIRLCGRMFIQGVYKVFGYGNCCNYLLFIA